MTLTLLAVFSLFLFFHLSSFSQSLPIQTNIDPTNLETLQLGGPKGPESIVFDSAGNGLYTGVSDGRILKWQGAERRWIEFAVTRPSRSNEECDNSNDPMLEEKCGRPLGLKFNKATGDLYIADACHGLFVVGPDGGVATQLVNETNGVPFPYTNDLDIDQETGAVYFTVTSLLFQRREYAFAVITRDRTGKLLKYDPKSKEVTVLLEGIASANGVALSQDSSFLLVAETGTGKILRFWLQGHKAGTVEVFAQLLRFPDNVRRNSRGEFWVALSSGTRLFKRAASQKPDIIESTTLLDRVVAVRLSEEGEILEMLEDNEEILTSISEVEERNGSLWLGSVDNPYVGIYKH